MTPRICSIFLSVLVVCNAMGINEQPFIEVLAQCVRMSEEDKAILLRHADMLVERHALPESEDPPLFKAYPALKDRIAYIQLGSYPTPITKLTATGAIMGADSLYMKHDGLGGGYTPKGERLFGGNKVRKLEFLLADAKQVGARSVLTFGSTGSNHVVATAAYAHALGLTCFAMLKPQPNSRAVCRNLKLMKHYDAQVHWSANGEARNADTVRTYYDCKSTEGYFPYCIPTGGSCPRGILGFVNAAFELRDQVRQGVMPEPDYIYVPAGSFGTAAGLMVGCAAAGLKTVVVPVAVEPEDNPGDAARYIAQLARDTNNFLCSYDDSFPVISIDEKRIPVVARADVCGDGYGQFIEAAGIAVRLLKHNENVQLDGTYTAKGWVGMVLDILDQDRRNKTILFWNTFCGEPFTEQCAQVDYHDLPEQTHAHFEQDVQECDYEAAYG